MGSAEPLSLANHPADVIVMTPDVSRDESILGVLEGSGIQAAFSCEQGVCGTCVIPVLKGEPDQRDRLPGQRQRVAVRLSEDGRSLICAGPGECVRLVLSRQRGRQRAFDLFFCIALNSLSGETIPESRRI